MGLPAFMFEFCLPRRNVLCLSTKGKSKCMEEGKSQEVFPESHGESRWHSLRVLGSAVLYHSDQRVLIRKKSLEKKKFFSCDHQKR